MDIVKKITKNDVVGWSCDVCFAVVDEHHGTLNAYWSHATDECHLCENCYGKVVNFISEKLQGKVRTMQGNWPGKKVEGKDFVVVEDQQ